MSRLEPVHNWHPDIHQNVIVYDLTASLSQIKFDLVVSLQSIKRCVGLHLELTRENLLKWVDVKLAIIDE